MPREPKYTKQEVVDEAIKLVDELGIEALTARNLGKRLGGSSRPLFTTFENMEEILQKVKEGAKAIYDKQVEEALKKPFGFRETGITYIMFAVDHPNLFKFLFIDNVKENFNIDEVLQGIEDNYSSIINYVKENTAMDLNFVKRIYLHMWIYSHGIATLCAEKVCHFTKEEITSMLTETYQGLTKQLKGEKKNDSSN